MTNNERAARLHAEANRTDPFAYRRMLLHLEKGIEDPHKVIEEAKRLINARKGR